MNWFTNKKDEIEWVQTRKNIEKLEGTKSALLDGTPITIVGPNYNKGRVIIVNEETEQTETVDIEDIAQDIKPKFLWW